MMLFKKSPIVLMIALVSIVAVAFQTSNTQSVSKETAFAKAADAYFQSVLDELGAVPGVSVAVVKGDALIYVKGFGHGDVANKQKVDASTNFYIASCTKSFTALLALHLDQKGTIKLDDPVTKYLPEVEFDERLEADKITIRDLLRHTSGMSNGPIVHRLAYSGQHELDKLIKLVERTEPNEAGRGNFQYSNFGYNLYTIISDKITGKPWQDWLREVIFQPMGMERTTAYMSNVKKYDWDLAKPYMNLIGTDNNEVYLIKTDKSMQSAGGLITTAEDAARWLELQINRGKLNGRQVFPKEMIAYTRQKHAATGSEAFGAFGRAYYGMGWRIGEYNGHPNVNHFGGYPGYLSHISFDPEAQIGVAVFTNEGYWGDNVMNLFAGFVYDYWYGDPEEVIEEYEQKKTQLVAHCKDVTQKIQAHQDELAERTWQLTDPFTAYSGTYVNEDYGTVEISGYANRLEVRNGNLQCVATPYTKKNTIRVELIPGRGEVVAFQYKNGEVVGFKNGGSYFEKTK